MKTYYVRPQREGGYGAGDGATYESAWNGLDQVDWQPGAAVAVRRPRRPGRIHDRVRRMELL